MSRSSPAGLDARAAEPGSPETPVPRLRPEPALRDVPQSSFHRGRTVPRGVRWFGASSFWGHLRHFVASAVATEDVDSRDWMTPDDPHELCRHVGRILSRAQGVEEKSSPQALSLTEQLGRDLWVDYVADTGDDADVSEAVARLVVAEYYLPVPPTPGRPSDATGSGGEVLAPRGDILFFGGDTAYPVATAEEIHDRVVVPFNRVLATRDDGKMRVLLGIPGNHDWYDGLDGFARLFRKRPYEVIPPIKTGGMYATLQRGELSRYTEFAKRFMLGEHIEKPSTLDLLGYRPAQSASYFALPLAPGLHLYAVDRQLRHVDYRQRQYFDSWRLRHPGAGRVIALPDPPYHFGSPNFSGQGMLKALSLKEGSDEGLVISGDIHHYERWQQGATSYVVAGGGGAFLHPAPIVRRNFERDAEWPGPRQSRRLLWSVPIKVALGRSGILPHFVFGLLLAPVTAAVVLGAPELSWVFGGLAFAFVTAALALIGGIRRKARLGVLFAAALTAALSLSAPWLVDLGFRGLGYGPVSDWFAVGEGMLPSLQALGGVLAGVALASVVASGAFGTYLMVLTLFGVENTQAFTALDHPGFKHFLRLRVRRDGRGIDVWCIGLTDPLRPGEAPVLVDAFFWPTRR